MVRTSNSNKIDPVMGVRGVTPKLTKLLIQLHKQTKQSFAAAKESTRTTAMPQTYTRSGKLGRLQQKNKSFTVASSTAAATMVGSSNDIGGGESRGGRPGGDVKLVSNSNAALIELKCSLAHVKLWDPSLQTDNIAK